MFTHEEILSLQSEKEKAESQLYDAVALLEQIQSDFVGRDWERKLREFLETIHKGEGMNRDRKETLKELQAESQKLGLYGLSDKQLTEIEKGERE